ncbi:oxygen-independent coproporphyrinogen-3 oxidase [Zymomonas mobilis]|uniref:radical SAM family heme chaperone HemW n=1 Tax=Zymomonas mobilis TaxID=542 RepID=UPI000B390528|nr:radical SAM family heme chaperone HemW [Zymomonas mobilis]ART93634.1 coproporphyrinogen III oxidase [Zymomonas mobilis subsp. mobilis]TWD60349.1 oxygen-independent coproporphyrinogen-3 oxidase [Zymomonas mobilis]
MTEQALGKDKRQEKQDMPLALYIHWPFCLAKCPYCDFNSHVRPDIDAALWRDALLSDMAHEAALTQGRRLSSIFFGGGTPSLMPPETVAALIDAATRYWQPTSDIEITLEANPSSVEADRFQSLALAGVNRLSLGIQALDDTSLHFLGRIHNVQEALSALDIAQKNFSRVSFDLIYGRPNQSLKDWEEELKQALAFGSDHLSLYQLTIEEGTRFHSLVRQGQFTPMDGDKAADLFDLTRDMTKAAGIPAYEISNHARKNSESRHNLTYWRYGDYIGIGAGAHGRRLNNVTIRHKKPENWLSAVQKQQQGIQEETPLSPKDQAIEAVLMGLRLTEGIHPENIQKHTGLDISEFLDIAAIQYYSDQGLLIFNNGLLRITEQGVLLTDALIREISL